MVIFYYFNANNEDSSIGAPNTKLQSVYYSSGHPNTFIPGGFEFTKSTINDIEEKFGSAYDYDPNNEYAPEGHTGYEVKLKNGTDNGDYRTFYTFYPDGTLSGLVKVLKDGKLPSPTTTSPESTSPETTEPGTTTPQSDPTPVDPTPIDPNPTDPTPTDPTPTDPTPEEPTPDPVQETPPTDGSNGEVPAQ